MPQVCNHCLTRALEVSTGLPRRRVVPLHHCNLRDALAAEEHLPFSLSNKQRSSRACLSHAAVVA